MLRMIRVSIPERSLWNIVRGKDRIDWAASDIPPDVKSDGCMFDVFSRTIQVYLRHDSFEPVDEGKWLPERFLAFTNQPADPPDEAEILKEFYAEVCAEAESVMQQTGTISGAHWNAMQRVLHRRGIEVPK